MSMIWHLVFVLICNPFGTFKVEQLYMLTEHSDSLSDSLTVRTDALTVHSLCSFLILFFSLIRDL